MFDINHLMCTPALIYLGDGVRVHAYVRVCVCLRVWPSACICMCVCVSPSDLERGAEVQALEATARGSPALRPGGCPEGTGCDCGAGGSDWRWALVWPLGWESPLPRRNITTW